MKQTQIRITNSNAEKVKAIAAKCQTAGNQRSGGRASASNSYVKRRIHLSAEDHSWLTGISHVTLEETLKFNSVHKSASAGYRHWMEQLDLDPNRINIINLTSAIVNDVLEHEQIDPDKDFLEALNEHCSSLGAIEGNTGAVNTANVISYLIHRASVLKAA